MDKPDPDPNLPRGMLRIAKRGENLEPQSSGMTVPEISPVSNRRTDSFSEEKDVSSARSSSNPGEISSDTQPRRGVLRINTADPGMANAVRFSGPDSPLGRNFQGRGAVRGGSGGGPRIRQPAAAPMRSPITPRTENNTVLRADFVRPMRIATNVNRPVGPSVAAKGGNVLLNAMVGRVAWCKQRVVDWLFDCSVVPSIDWLIDWLTNCLFLFFPDTLTPEGKSSGPVFASDFATQEIFRALEQAKPTSIPKPPVPELTDEQKADPSALREFYLTQLRMLAKDSQILRDFVMAKPVKLIDSYFFWCLRKGPALEQLIQAVNPKNQNYQVVGVIGLQETGKSYILSQLIGQKVCDDHFYSLIVRHSRNVLVHCFQLSTSWFNSCSLE